uniref:Uncharacterized protein n=1 Tax=Anguilla anguilla TaxID=7936 RepID=A0A0E9T1B5_ANGAN
MAPFVQLGTIWFLMVPIVQLCTSSPREEDRPVCSRLLHRFGFICTSLFVTCFYKLHCEAL